MTRCSLLLRRFLQTALMAACGIVLVSPASAWSILKPRTTGSLPAFQSEEELSQWLNQKKAQLDAQRQRRQGSQDKMLQKEAAAPMAALSMADNKSVAQESESVTNTQTAGVDEGGIVKVHNNHLVVLRRGRLFTIDVSKNRLAPVSVVDAFAPGSSGQAWYDEMLVADNTVAVIGYSYSKGGTEVVLFNISREGQLSYKSTHILRSNDYYSSRNYASRLIGNKLIFYTPLYINFYGNPLDYFPAVRSWHDGKAGEFKRIAPATRIYRTDEDLNPAQTAIALHSVQICDLGNAEMTCKATGILAPAGREFYVAKDAVYIWTTPFSRYGRRAGNDAQPVSASVFRLPLDERQAPSAIKTMGSPIDQFSFLESGDGYLNILLRSEGPAASMWSSEGGSKDLALLRLPLNLLGNGTQSVPLNHYYPLPSPQGGRSIQNRYIGNYLVYGAGNTWGRNKLTENAAYALMWKNPQQAPVKLEAAHTVDRIEALGNNALLVGTENRNLIFTTVALRNNGSTPRVSTVSSFSLPNAAQGETRSHGFFYKPDSASSGILGLPFRGGGGSGWKQLRNVSSGIVYVKNSNLTLSEMGILGASPKPNRNDNCKASCVDWYGNSRPLFLKGRIFALMGYELVEGTVSDNRITESRRIDFSPAVSPAQRR